MFWLIIFYGSVWGIFESTVGYMLHLFPIRIGSFIWLPVACFFMHQIYRATGKYSSVIYIAIFSAGIKLMNLFMPISIDKVINPAISIILEGFAFIVVLYLVNQRSALVKSFFFNTFWRTLYLVYLLFVPEWMLEKSALASFSNLFEFFILSNLKSSIGIYIYFKVQKRFHIPAIKIANPTVAIWLCILNVICIFSFSG